MIVNFGHLCVFEHLAENLFDLVDVGLALGEGPAAELQTEVLEVDMTEFSGQGKHGLEVFESAVGELSGVEPESLDVFLDVFDDVAADFR